MSRLKLERSNILYKSHSLCANQSSSDDSNESDPSERELITIHITQPTTTTRRNGGGFEWKDVNVTINGKQILHNISGRVGSGQLLGILGGSGAGKTILLNALSGRIINCKSSAISGFVAYKGHKRQLGYSASIKNISAYVMQNNAMCSTATCEEALLFSARLRSGKSKEEQTEIIDDVIASLELDQCKNTRIGNELIDGMSGGEKKRTAVGVHLVTAPSLIFLDEPTSGLDSFTALKTLDILKHLTLNQGKQVIATIHQPSSEIFKMIDILVLLAKGHIVYYGPTEKVVGYFDDCGYECPQYTNIADFVVNTVQEHSEFFIEQWKEHEKDFIKLSFDDYDKLKPKQPYIAPFYVQFLELLKREIKILYRNPRAGRIRLIQTLVFGLLVGTLFWNLTYDAEGMSNRFGVIFYLTVNSSVTALASTITVFPEQRVLFERERDANMYHTTTYLTAKFLIGLPESALFTLLYLTICYWMVGFDSFFIELYMALFLCSLSIGSVGLIVGCFAKNTAEAMQLLPLPFVPFILFTNFIVSLEQIPVWIRWLQWLDPFKYVIDAMCITEFEGQNKGIDYNGDAFLVQKSVGYTNIPSVSSDPWRNSLYFDYLMLIVLTLGCRVFAWVVLVRRNGL